MDIPHIKGRVAKQAHVGVPDGTFEEEYARNGFSGRYAHLYRRHAPTGWTRLEGPLRPHAYDLRRLETSGSDDWLAQRRGLLTNADVTLSFASLSKAMPYTFRNADADELLFVHDGTGTLQTDFGPLAYEPGDYLLLPRGTAYRLAPTAPSKFLTIEATSEIGFPDRGPLGQHALFDPAMVQVPEPVDQSVPAGPTGEWELRIRRTGEDSRAFYPFDPLDVVGWKGTLSAAKLNVRDIRPVSSDRYHLPPSAHATFVMQGAVICTFLPRPLENGDPEAMKVPFFHSNIDFDEVLFYHSGEFFSRAGIAPGMVTFHPQGIHHGPQKQAIERSRAATRTEEVAVMLDTRRPLTPCDAAVSTENTEYWRSWK